MAEEIDGVEKPLSWVEQNIFLGNTFDQYLRKLVTPFNIIAGLIILNGLVFLVIRFTQGLGSVIHASQNQPWGLFLNWGLFAGVPLAGTAFVFGTIVYIFGMEKYHPVVKNAVLIGFLGYLFAVISLLVDLGRPWRLPYPMSISFGTASILFVVSWTMALHLTFEFIEFSPALWTWLRQRNLARWIKGLTVGISIFILTISTIHQAALGALFLIVPGKLHPLWYTPYIPVLFLISAIAASLCMMIIVSFLTQRFFRKQADDEYLNSLDGITLGIGKAAVFVLFAYFALKIVALAQGNNWEYLGTGYGYWYMVEIFIFILLPGVLFIVATRKNQIGLVRFAAVLAILGVIVNRFNVSLIALNWLIPEREFFSLKEFFIVIGFVALEITVYRWIVNRMPILREHPDYQGE